MRIWSLLLAEVAIVCIAICCGRAIAAEPFFMGLGDLPGGALDSRAFGVSADGSVVVGTGNSASGNEAFRWTQDGGMIALSGASQAYDVSADGSVVVGQWGSQAARWTQATGFIGLGDIPGGVFFSFANAVSGDGTVVVGLGSSDRPFGHGGRIPYYAAVRWTQESGLVESGIDLLPKFDFRLALDISADGTVTVAGSNEAVSSSQATGLVGLGDLPDGTTNSRAFAVSADGAVIVGQGSSPSGAEAFRWTADTGMSGLGILPGFDFSLAQDVSSDGSAVVGSVGFGPETFAGAFIWDAAHGMRDLHDVLIDDFGLGESLAGWSLEYASAVSADGQVVVGYGTNPNGDTEGWIARVAPTTAVPGDVNFDGVVDIFDVNTVSAYWGTTGPQGDADGDGLVDIFDVNVISSNWNAAGIGSAAAVPEPAGSILVVVALVALIVRACSHRRI